MDVKVDDINRITVGSLMHGAVFLYAGSYYMVCEQELFVCSEITIVNISTGKLLTVPKDVIVSKYDSVVCHIK